MHVQMILAKRELETKLGGIMIKDLDKQQLNAVAAQLGLGPKFFPSQTKNLAPKIERIVEAAAQSLKAAIAAGTEELSGIAPALLTSS